MGTLSEANCDCIDHKYIYLAANAVQMDFNEESGPQTRDPGIRARQLTFVTGVESTWQEKK